MDPAATSLDELRRRIDALDDRLHDLLMERAALVGGITAVKQSAGVPTLRPGREAQILRRLAARHRGPFPRQSLVRLWRELLGGMVAIQGGFVVAVTVPEGQPGLWDLARDHFGGYLTLAALGSAAAVVDAVVTGRAAIGLVPMPRHGDEAPWWPALFALAETAAPRVVARLPFGGPGNGRTPADGALVIGRAGLDPSGEDRSLLMLASRPAQGGERLRRALSDRGHPVEYLAGPVAASGRALHLIELDGVVVPGDERLAGIAGDIEESRLLGIYARPLPPEGL